MSIQEIMDLMRMHLSNSDPGDEVLLSYGEANRIVSYFDAHIEQLAKLALDLEGARSELKKIKAMLKPG